MLNSKTVRRGEMVMCLKNSKVGSIVDVYGCECKELKGNARRLTVRWNGENNLQALNTEELIWDDDKCYWILK